MAKRVNHYAKVDEKFVKTTILYPEWLENGTSDVMLYYDKDCKDPVYTDELEDLYLDGFVVCAPPPVGISGVPKCYYKPSACNADDGSVGLLDFFAEVFVGRTTKRPVDVNESNAIFYLEKMTLDGFEEHGEINTSSGDSIPYYNAKGEYFDQPIALKNQLICDETYIVNWDGTEYECVLTEIEGGFYLGINYYGGIYDGTYPFGVFVGSRYDSELNGRVTTGIKIVIATTPETSHTISIYKMK